MTFYEQKDSSYFKNIRYDIIDLIPNGENKILDIGCGEGKTLLELKKQSKAQYIVGVDVRPLGQEKSLDGFFNIDIEHSDLPYSDGFFDVIICADVLEHLIDPWETIRRLKKYLKSGGYLIASIPNIREIRTLYTILMQGDFRYVNAGILDISHLRFFCKKNIRELFEKAGYKIMRLTYDLDHNSKRKLINRLSFGFLEELIVIQYLVIAVNNQYAQKPR